uniref:Uncharacterized protein n=1 Tax=Melopsittacus undulatus TaxID=13146 RepID=A0A8C6JIC9_MELUD
VLVWCFFLVYDLRIHLSFWAIRLPSPYMLLLHVYSPHGINLTTVHILLYTPHSTTMLSITHASLQPTHFTMHTHHLLQFAHLAITVCPPSPVYILSLPTTLICRYTQNEFTEQPLQVIFPLFGLLLYTSVLA